jgi:general nucleoside transport system permease protein
MISALMIVAALGDRITGLLPGTVSGMTPVLLAALGGALTWYAGIFNIAMEGMLLTGALGAVIAADGTGSWVAGLIGGVAGAMVLSVIYVVFVVIVGADEFVTGIALNLAALGGTTFLLRKLYDVGSYNPSDLPQVPSIDVPLLREIPLIGSLFRGDLNLLDVMALVATAVVAIAVTRTRFGLRLRAAGSSAQSLDASGVSTGLVRILAVVWCGILCGLGGAWLSIGFGRGFGENMSNGKGWIALVAVILAKGRAWTIAAAAAVFGFADALGLFAQGYSVPSQLSSMFPYLATLVALFIAARRTRLRTQSPSQRSA